MRSVSVFFSLQRFVISLASIGALTSVCAVPFPSDYVTFDRRNTMTISGKVAELGKKLSPSAHKKSTVYHLDKWDGQTHTDPSYCIKIYTVAALEEKEIKGLTAAGQYIASDAKEKAVVMIEVTGPTMAEMVAAVEHSKRKAYVDEWRPKVAAAAATLASTRDILHTDLNMNNVVVNGQHIQFIDWEHYALKGEKDFTTDKEKILANLNLVWDSTGTPPEAKNSPSVSPKGSPKGSAKGSPSPKGSPKKGGLTRRSLVRREVFYYD